MKALKITLIYCFLFSLVSCKLNFSVEKDSKMKQKTIDGVDYTFLSNSNRKEWKILFFEARQFDLQVHFTGLDEPIHQSLNWGDFEEKLEAPNCDFVLVDSLSFEVSEAKDQVDLVYHLKFVEGEHHTPADVSFQMNRTNDSWVIQ